MGQGGRGDGSILKTQVEGVKSYLMKGDFEWGKWRALRKRGKE